MKNLLLALAFTLIAPGCSSRLYDLDAANASLYDLEIANASLYDLEITNANLEMANNVLIEKSKELEVLNHYLCAAIIEEQTMGGVVYLGDYRFYSQGEIIEYENLDGECYEIIHNFILEIPKRMDIINSMSKEASSQ